MVTRNAVGDAAHPVATREDVLAGRPVSMKWGAIFGGAVAALGIWAMLYSLGLALGLSSVDPNDPSSLKASGIFTGVWSLVAPILALFVGGMVASRGAGVMTKTGGAIHGLVMWGLSVLVGAWLLTSLLSSVLGGVATVGKTAVQAGAGAVGGAVGGVALGADGAVNVAERLGLNMDDALRPVNERLAAEGKPAVTAAQLSEGAKDVVQEGVRQGRFDRELLTSNLAQNTALSRADAEEIATRLETQFQNAKAQVSDRLESAKQTAQTGALKAADATGKAFWGVFFALLLGMVSAIVGATLGVSRRQQAWAADSQGAPLPVGRREAYP